MSSNSTEPNIYPKERDGSERFATSISQVSEQKGWLQQNMANDRREWC